MLFSRLEATIYWSPINETTLLLRHDEKRLKDIAENGILEGYTNKCHDEVEFDYKEGSEKGPSKWGELKKEWETCKCGKMQSPIDLSSCKVKIMRKMGHKKHYKPSNSTIKNRGHDISLQWHGDAGSIWMNGTKYSLLQIHWHFPSEHTINGRRYALELHMVHQSTEEKNKKVVKAVLYKLGRPDPFLFTLRRHVFSLIDQEGAERNLGMINPNYIANMHSKRYYKYKGSLTIPPCTEGVTWIVNKKEDNGKLVKLLFL
ncbi:hypothetical protein RND71_038883 [Anisodus tanguticus]|uniref:Carbonic anhydrase n=1 Tax=Anisodus tanguticus TaxID=243964 RepID=A0AAE1R3I5_9SOLA|nr:hypothetical protein RND71_038883 [Anisodus tanguticus]